VAAGHAGIAGEAPAPLARHTGVALGAVTGRSASMAPTIRAEVGPDMRQGPPVKHFCSRLGLAPHHAVSGGSVGRSRPLQGVRRAPHAVRPAAQAVARSGASLDASCRAMRARLGPPQTTVATAQTLARGV